ncbi:MAG: hypothetical protein J3Q66DRAFT_57890, partial [Benniella sp.]
VLSPSAATLCSTCLPHSSSVALWTGSASRCGYNRIINSHRLPLDIHHIRLDQDSTENCFPVFLAGIVHCVAKTATFKSCGQVCIGDDTDRRHPTRTQYGAEQLLFVDHRLRPKASAERISHEGDKRARNLEKKLLEWITAMAVAFKLEEHHAEVSLHAIIMLVVQREQSTLQQHLAENSYPDFKLPQLGGFRLSAAF